MPAPLSHTAEKLMQTFRMPRELVTFLKREATERGVDLTGHVVRYLEALRTWFGFLAAEGHIADDPTDRLEAPGRGRSLPVVLTVEQVLCVLEGAGQHAQTAQDTAGLPPRAKAAAFRDLCMLEMLYGSGLRISELTGLAVRDVDTEEGFAVVHGKGGKTRIVPVGGGATRALRRYLETWREWLERPKTSHGALFLSQRGTPLSRTGAWKVVKDAVERARPRARRRGGSRPRSMRGGWGSSTPP